MLLTERGVTYEFRVSALNSVDYGEEAVGTIRTPDGSECGTVAATGRSMQVSGHARQWQRKLWVGSYHASAIPSHTPACRCSYVYFTLICSPVFLSLSYVSPVPRQHCL